MKANVMIESSLTAGILFLTKEITTLRMTKKNLERTEQSLRFTGTALNNLSLQGS
jgi:hypothetical protein